MNRPCCNLKMTHKLFVFIWALDKETACYPQMGLAFLGVKWALFTSRKKDQYFVWHMLDFSLSFLFFLFVNMEAQTMNQ